MSLSDSQTLYGTLDRIDVKTAEIETEVKKMMTMGSRVRESLFYYGDTFEVILGIYVSDQRRTVVHHNVTSSLCVTCTWQWWARGIVRLGMGGAPSCCNHSVHFMVLSIVLYHVCIHG